MRASRGPASPGPNGSVSAVQRVLAYLLKQRAPVTRPEVAAACQLSRPSVFTAIEKLEAAGLAAAVGQLSGKPGRSADLFEVPLSAGALLAIDVGGSNLRAAASDLRGNGLAESRRATKRTGGEAILTQSIELAGQVLTDAGLAPEDLRAVGVSMPGVVARDGDTVRYASNIDQFDPFDFATPLESALHAPVTMDNNVNLAALGERWRGDAGKFETFAVIAVGAGIGAGIVHDGILLRGAHGAAGEVAFLPPDGESRKVDAHAHDAAGGLALLQDARSRPDWPDTPPTTVEELFAWAQRGVAPAVDLVEEECARLARVVASVCAVVDPEAVVLTGGVGGNRRLIDTVERLVAQHTIYPPKVLASALAERTSLTGATYLAMQRAREGLTRSVAKML